MIQPNIQSPIRSIDDLHLKNQAVFLRLDLNVPLKKGTLANGEEGLIVDEDNRILEALPTIRKLVESDARVIIASHLGRPDGKVKREYSLLPVANRLAELLEKEVTLADDCVGEGIEMMIKSMKNGQILMLENLRFHAEEEKNDPGFVQALGKLATIYVTDAFGTAHRKHASTYGLPYLFQSRLMKRGPENNYQVAMGYLIQNELKYLDLLMKDPPRPFYTLLGGSKVSDKIKTIEFLLQTCDGILVGGAMGHAFWKAANMALPEKAKQPSAEDIEAAKQLLQRARQRGIPFLIPTDTTEGFDIGPKTVDAFSNFLSKAKTVFWNGPLGWFEKEPYNTGTNKIAEALAKIDAVKFVGGGDTVSAVKKSGFAENFTHLSTGGGAVLEYLEGHGLPGIEVLKPLGKAPESIDLEVKDEDDHKY